MARASVSQAICRMDRRRLKAMGQALAAQGIRWRIRPSAGGTYALRVPTANAKQAGRILATWMRKHLTPAERAKQLVDEAWVSYDERKFAAAQAILQAALADDPTDPIVLTCLGAVLTDRCLPALAVPFLEKAVKAASTDRNTYLNLGFALLDSGEGTAFRTRRLFKKAYKLKPSPQTWEAHFDPQGR